MVAGKIFQFSSLAPAVSLWLLRAQRCLSVLRVNFQIKTFSLNGNSDPTGTCLSSCTYHPIAGGFFVLFFLLRISFDSCCTAGKSRHQNRPAAANNRGKAKAL